MHVLRALLLAVLPLALCAQPQCPETPTYAVCDLAFELNESEASAHRDPHATVQMRAEFRSPRHRTFLMPAFWDGGRRLIIRFSPVDAGAWEFRITSNIARFHNLTGKFNAPESNSPGFIVPANVHHWSHTEGQKPHLWMGDTAYNIAELDMESFRKLVDARAAQKFTHIRGHALPVNGNPDRPAPEYFRSLDERVRYMNGKGIVFDMILGRDQNHLRKVLPMPQQRERFLRYMVARYSAFNITWQLMQEWEEYSQGRELAREMGLALKGLDPYNHPRTAHTVATSAPLLPDKWMDHVLYQSSDITLGSIEHQLYPVPFVNAEFAYEDSGAGRSHPHHVDTREFRNRLWHATMNGQYPTFGNTGTYGGLKVPQNLKFLDSPGARQMTVWFDFFAATRHWELEPFFDLDGGRAIALPGVEYIVYVDKPGPIEVRVERHGYNVRWFNPSNGEWVKLKDWKGERWAGEPPTRDHDWVLHISREERKEGMLRSWKFESRPNLMQEIEQGGSKVPFEIAEPAKDEISISVPPVYEAKLKRETRGTRSVMYLWTGEVSTDAQGYRVLGTGPKGTLRIPKDIAAKYPNVLNLRLAGMNANGKVYLVDKVYRITQ